MTNAQAFRAGFRHYVQSEIVERPHGSWWTMDLWASRWMERIMDGHEARISAFGVMLFQSFMNGYLAARERKLKGKWAK